MFTCLKVGASFETPTFEQTVKVLLAASGQSVSRKAKRKRCLTTKSIG